MASPMRIGSRFRISLSCATLLVFALVLAPIAVKSQETDDDHDRDHLHFSHPLVTESPTPDTKIRLDYVATNISDRPGLHENTIRIEGEYAFTHIVSLALVTPFTFRTAPVNERTRGLGDIELSLKAASLAYGEKRILLGGGLSVGIPTGSDVKRIGSSHIVEIEPFIDAAYKREQTELVGFARLSSTVHRRPGEDAERVLAFDFSALRRLNSSLEGLIELTTQRSLIAADSGAPQTFIAPGFKTYPFANKKLMFGASLELGTGAARHQQRVLASGFYHF